MKNKKGFTLIELLAVIVILGLLMAIAIPSVTKYITESRKKTVVSTIENYITAMVNEVNDLTYTFTEENTIYAVPIECIALERGGRNPFGAWHQANDAYWAYVLVQYDDETSSYRYGYTFKDSAGYGLYPTTQAKLNEGGKQIQTGLKLNRPSNGKITNITSVDNWSGFDVDSTTNLVVLKSEAEGNVGDGKTTCTLHQKGDNYDSVINEKDEELVIDTPVLFGKPYELVTVDEDFAYIFYEDGSAKAYYECELDIEEPAGTFSYEGNQIIFVPDNEVYYIISDDKKSITETWDDPYTYELNTSDSWCKDEYAHLPMIKKTNSYTEFWEYKEQIKTITFQNSINIPSSIPDEHKWDMTRSKTGKVMAYIKPNTSNSSYYDLYIQGDGKIYANPDSSWLFGGFTYLDKINNINLLDISYVKNMNALFYQTGKFSSVFTLDLGNNFNTSDVTDMNQMFLQTGYSNVNFTLNLGDKFDTSNVTNMSGMFYGTGYSSKIFTLNLGSKFNTTNVTDMNEMFSETGYSSTKFKLDLGDKFDTKNVTQMIGMFMNTGYNSPIFTLDLGNKFNTSKVTNMRYMFFQIGSESTVFTLDLGDYFYTSNVTEMHYMFKNVGWKNPTFTLELGDKFDTSKVTNMRYMFDQIGFESTMFELDLGNKFNTSNVTDMSGMFRWVGINNPNFVFDLGDNFYTNKVTNMSEMFYAMGRDSTNFEINLGNKFDTSNVTNMSGMFNGVGRNSKNLVINLGDKFDTSNVTNMSEMFVNVGSNDTDFLLDCSKWNVQKVTNNVKFNYGVSMKVIAPNWPK